jgi:hypothetical protein
LASARRSRLRWWHPAAGRRPELDVQIS